MNKLKNPCNTKRRESSTICIIYRYTYHMDSYNYSKNTSEKSRFLLQYRRKTHEKV